MESKNFIITKGILSTVEKIEHEMKTKRPLSMMTGNGTTINQIKETEPFKQLVELYMTSLHINTYEKIKTKILDGTEIERNSLQTGMGRRRTPYDLYLLYRDIVEKPVTFVKWCSELYRNIKELGYAAPIHSFYCGTPRDLVVTHDVRSFFHNPTDKDKFGFSLQNYYDINEYLEQANQTI